MDKLIIRGGRPLRGSIPISGAKNAALPLMAAALLTDRALRLSNMPRLADLATMGDLLNHHGAMVALEAGNGNGGGAPGRTMTLHAAAILDPSAPYDIVRKMRASILVLGPLLAREGIATVSLPGGCAIGTRPIDLHLMGLEALGAKMTLDAGYVSARAPARGLAGGIVRFPKVSVGATENLLMAATLARGGTRLENAAAEPEIVDLGRCLVAMGARIDGLGTRTIEIEGVDTLSGAEYHCMPDRIEAGSYAVAAAISGGDLLLEGADPASMTAILECLEAAGAAIVAEAGGLRVARRGPLRPIEVETTPYPGFPTDMQAQIMTLATLAPGRSVITESIFENRFMHVQELVRLGANIRVEGARAVVSGVTALKGAPVMATDLRASMSLVLAGLVAEGTTELHRLYHLDRGYERIEEKLVRAGADVERVAA